MKTAKLARANRLTIDNLALVIASLSGSERLGEGFFAVALKYTYS